MAVGFDRQDVEFLASIDAVVVADVAETLEDVERAVDGRWRRRRVDGAAALDELGAGDVTVGPAQDLDQGPPLRRPAQTVLVETLADLAPGGGGRTRLLEDGHMRGMRTHGREYTARRAGADTTCCNTLTLHPNWSTQQITCHPPHGARPFCTSPMAT